METGIPSLIRPYHAAMLDSAISPVFEWSPVDGLAENYYVVFVRLDNSGSYTDDVIFFEVPIFIKALPMDITLWNQFSPGVWAWTVLAQYPDSILSNFMIYRFMKY